MKKRNSKGRFIYDKNWYIRNHEKVLFMLSLVVLAYMYFVTVAQAQEKPLELSCDKFLSPISCDEIYGFNNLDLNNEKTFTRTPNKDDIVQAPEKELSIEDKIMHVFGEDGEVMVKIAKCESGLRPDAENPNSSATGLFQILSSLHQVKKQWLKNPDTNIAIAKQMHDASGTNPWKASIHCWGE